ncbi:hypothetical protein ACHAW6_008159 [Cyclotella cf. meneghiniana]
MNSPSHGTMWKHLQPGLQGGTNMSDSITAQPAMRLAIALASFQALGEYDASIHDWEAKPAHNKMFTNFRPFIQREFTNPLGKAFFNQAQEKDSPSEADQAAWALAEVASIMQAALEKQMENTWVPN